MLRIVLLILHLIINAGITCGLDEGSFLWAQRKPEDLSTEKGSGVKPGRWTRSVFNWLHSPLINSIQEAFVADSIYENSPLVTKCVKRSILKNASDVNIKESFENEFFLWEDNEGNPLEFGLKQIQDVRPCSQPVQNNKRVNRGRPDNLWEEPLIYEYNQDVKDVDINHLSFHEKFKLNDILKNKLHAFSRMFTFKHTTKQPSMYYTLSHSTNTTSTINCTNGNCSTENSSKKEHIQPHLKNKLKNSFTTLSSDMIENQQNPATAGSTKNVYGGHWSPFEPTESKKETYYNTVSSNDEGIKLTDLTTLASLNSKHLSTIAAKRKQFKSGNSKSVIVPLKALLDFHEANNDGEAIPYFMNDELYKHDRMKSMETKKNASNELSNHRKLRTIHHKRFLKNKRKSKRKSNKLKYPEGHSYQYELFNANFKSSNK